MGLKETHTDELVFALCGPIGSSLQAVTSTLEKLLRDQFDYEVKVVRLSEIIEQLDGSPVPKGAFARVSHLIERGNLLRQRFGPSILADVAIREIAVRREERKLPGDPAGVYRPARVCHIVDSIKNEAELEALRLVYRDMLHCIGVFSPMPHREQHLKAKGMDLSEIYKLIDQDSGEEFSHGQTVRKTFPKADYFLRAPLNGSNAVEARMLRYLNLVFSTAVITPTTAETAMYQAASASRNSACLSRQVGASIVDQNGLLLAIGWNDVPRFQGGLYVTRAEDVPPGLEDHRCANWGGKCYNDAEKSLIAAEATEALAKAGLLVGDRDAAIKTILESKVGRLIEFSRAIHAEMHAILSASHSAGARLKGASLYCTTYPCHYCARHIVAAGIISVYYIQPYGKSLAGKLHHDSISEAEGTQNRVTILPYDGVAPSKYLELFAMPTDERKDKGGVLKSRNPRDARPKSEVTLESLPALEGLVVTRLKNQNLLSSDEGGAA
ncbi:MAG: anti-phage dCTP deaminase [Polyangiaceae bacterium]